jgi:uncharacterized protein
MEITRNYPDIKSFIDSNASIIVLGPRGTGKTSFLKKIINEHNNVLQIDLLNESLFGRYVKNPSLLASETKALLGAQNSGLIFIDEVQRIPELLNEVHRLLEQYKERIIFILTGSSARKLKAKDANLLAGRALKIDFFPFDIYEIGEIGSIDFCLQYGTLPKSFTQKNARLRSSYLKSYVGMYLQEEIQREAQIRNLQGFSRFLEVAASENGNLVNYFKIAKSSGVSDVTVKEYYNILVDTLLVYHVPAWTYSLREQLQKSPKYYFFDNGVLNALLGDINSELKSSTYRYGKLFENFCVAQILQQLSKKELPLKAYHYRTHSGKEIDLILQKNPHTNLIALEFKSSANPITKDFSTLKDFQNKYPESLTLVVCQTTNPYIEDNIHFCSLKDALYKIEIFSK